MEKTTAKPVRRLGAMGASRQRNSSKMISASLPANYYSSICPPAPRHRPSMPANIPELNSDTLSMLPSSLLDSGAGLDSDEDHQVDKRKKVGPNNGRMCFSLSSKSGFMPSYGMPRRPRRVRPLELEPGRFCLTASFRPMTPITEPPEDFAEAGDLDDALGGAYMPPLDTASSWRATAASVRSAMSNKDKLTNHSAPTSATTLDILLMDAVEADVALEVPAEKEEQDDGVMTSCHDHHGGSDQESGSESDEEDESDDLEFTLE